MPKIEDLLGGLDSLYPKSRKHTLDALKQLWAWAADRRNLSPMTKWPRLGYVEMSFRQTVDLEIQEVIIHDIKAHEPFRVWLCVKWLATYIAIRPGEMRSLTEGQVNRQRGLLIIPHPKEKRAKVIPLIQEDLGLIRAPPLAFDPAMPFFRHEAARGGGYKSRSAFWPNISLPGLGEGLRPTGDSWRLSLSRHQTFNGHGSPGRGHAGRNQVHDPAQHSTSAAFHRYFQTGGEALRELQGRR